MPLFITSIVTSLEFSLSILHSIYSAIFDHDADRHDQPHSSSFKGSNRAASSRFKSSNEKPTQPWNTEISSKQQPSKNIASNYDIHKPLTSTNPGQIAGADTKNIPDLALFTAVLENLKKVAVVNQTVVKKEFTYGQLLYDVVELRKKLGAVDITGARVAFLISRSYEYVVAQWATWAAGGIAVPLCDAHPPPELEYVITDSGAAIVIYHKSFAGKFATLQTTIPNIRWIEIDDYEVKDAEEVTQEYRMTKFDADRGAMLIYTSGTTGKPKGCLLTHTIIKHQVLSLVEAWKWTKEDKILHVLPLHHIHGIINCLTCPLWVGATVELDPKFSAKNVWARFKQSQDLTVFMAIPTIYSKLTSAYHGMSEDEKAKCTQACKQFRLMVSGSAALPESQFREWEEISGHQLLERFGMTEIGMGISNPLQGARRPGCVGTPLPHVEIRIVNDDGKDVTKVPNEAGMLYIKGPVVFKEYWGKPEATESAFRSFNGRDKWFITGDYACYTEDHVYKIIGRASSDIIKTGGYKVSAVEIENEVLVYPPVQECAVIGIPHPEWGEQVCAVCVLKPGKKHFELADLRAFLKSKLATYKIPAQLKFVDELPKNIMMKINKKELLALFATEQ